MREQFASHQVLATVACNAGPHRVQRWLPEASEMAADIRVETVPLGETWTPSPRHPDTRMPGHI